MLKVASRVLLLPLNAASPRDSHPLLPPMEAENNQAVKCFAADPYAALSQPWHSTSCLVGLKPTYGRSLCLDTAVIAMHTIGKHDEEPAH